MSRSAVTVVTRCCLRLRGHHPVLGVAIGLFERQAAGGLLRDRYGVNVRMTGIDLDTLKDIKAAVRAEFRGVSVPEFFGALRREPELPAEGHIVDRCPHHFGWRAWRLTDEGRLIPRIDSMHPLREADGAFETGCPHGNTVPSPDCYCGIHYYNTLSYCRSFLDAVSWVSETGGTPPVADGRQFRCRRGRHGRGFPPATRGHKQAH